MRSTNKLWLFFVLVAAGLIYAYSLVGKRFAERAAHPAAHGGASRQASVLHAEAGCDPERAPCAAYGHSAALVLQARWLKSGELAVAVGEVGFPTSGLDGAELLLLPRGAKRGFRAVYSDGGWKAVFPLASDTRGLEVRLRDAKRVWVADFPLPKSD